jgi:hypothetical protein
MGIAARKNDQDPIRGSHQGQRHIPHQQAGHMTCTRPQAARQIFLATRAPSTHDPASKPSAAALRYAAPVSDALYAINERGSRVRADQG